MTLTLELPTELETRLNAEALRVGLPLDKYALHLLSGEPSGRSSPTNGAELVDYWRREGVIGSRPEIEDSQGHSREIRRQAERRLASSGQK